MQRTGLGSIGTAVTGAAFFNDWSDPNGKVAMSFEVCALVFGDLLSQQSMTLLLKIGVPNG